MILEKKNYVNELIINISSNQPKNMISKTEFFPVEFQQLRRMALVPPHVLVQKFLFGSHQQQFQVGLLLFYQTFLEKSLKHRTPRNYPLLQAQPEHRWIHGNVRTRTRPTHLGGEKIDSLRDVLLGASHRVRKAPKDLRNLFSREAPVPEHPDLAVPCRLAQRERDPHRVSEVRLRGNEAHIGDLSHGLSEPVEVRDEGSRVSFEPQSDVGIGDPVISENARVRGDAVQSAEDMRVSFQGVDGSLLGLEKLSEAVERRNDLVGQARRQEAREVREGFGDFGVGDSFGFQELEFRENGFVGIRYENFGETFDQFRYLGFGETEALEKLYGFVWFIRGIELHVVRNR